MDNVLQIERIERQAAPVLLGEVGVEALGQFRDRAEPRFDRLNRRTRTLAVGLE